MKLSKSALAGVLGSGLLMVAAPALADDLEGRIESVDTANRTFTVQGIQFHVDDRTDYDDGLRSFSDLKVGQKVEVDFDWRDGRHVATEIELDD